MGSAPLVVPSLHTEGYLVPGLYFTKPCLRTHLYTWRDTAKMLPGCSWLLDGRLRVIFAQPWCLVEYFRFTGCIKNYFSSFLYFIKISARALL